MFFAYLPEHSLETALYPLADKNLDATLYHGSVVSLHAL